MQVSQHKRCVVRVTVNGPDKPGIWPSDGHKVQLTGGAGGAARACSEVQGRCSSAAVALSRLLYAHSMPSLLCCALCGSPGPGRRCVRVGSAGCLEGTQASMQFKSARIQCRLQQADSARDPLAGPMSSSNPMHLPSNHNLPFPPGPHTVMASFSPLTMGGLQTNVDKAASFTSGD